MVGGYYSRVVQYVGNLDIVNSVKISTNTYSEVYVYVPTKDGNTPYVLFKNISDKNYYPDYQWTNNPNNPLNDEYLVGRNYDETNPSGLTNLAIFDDDVLGVPTASYIDTGVSASSIAGNWYSPRDTANTYFTDSSFVDPSNYILTKTDNSNSLTYIRSKLDSIGIDFNPNSYQGIISDPSISTLEEFNATADAADFEFNAVLIYYDVYDPAIPTDVATNLYGVLFLDDVNTSSGDVFIPKALVGVDLANAFMKAHTKAIRRTTLAMCGLGFLDETEVSDIPNYSAQSTVKFASKADKAALFARFSEVAKNVENLKEMMKNKFPELDSATMTAYDIKEVSDWLNTVQQ